MFCKYDLLLIDSYVITNYVSRTEGKLWKFCKRNTFKPICTETWSNILTNSDISILNVRFYIVVCVLSLEKKKQLPFLNGVWELLFISKHLALDYFSSLFFELVLCYNRIFPHFNSTIYIFSVDISFSFYQHRREAWLSYELRFLAHLLIFSSANEIISMELIYFISFLLSLSGFILKHLLLHEVFIPYSFPVLFSLSISFPTSLYYSSVLSFSDPEELVIVPFHFPFMFLLLISSSFIILFISVFTFLFVFSSILFYHHNPEFDFNIPMFDLLILFCITTLSSHKLVSFFIFLHRCLCLSKFLLLYWGVVDTCLCLLSWFMKTISLFVN